MAMPTVPQNRTTVDALSVIRHACLGEPETVLDAVIPFLKHRSGLVVQAAAKGLGELERPESVTPLMEAYERADSGGAATDKGCHTRIAIVKALGQIGIAIAEPVVRRAVRTIQIETVGFGREDTALDLRASAAFALTRIDPVNAIHDLALLLFDSEPNLDVNPRERPFSKARTRMAAAKAIANLGYATGAALLAVKLRFGDDEISEVLGECLEAFISLDPPNVLEIVTPYLEGDDSFLAGMAATSLAGFMGESALDMLANSFARIPPEARVTTVLAITGIRSTRTGEILVRFLQDSDPKVRLAAVNGATFYLSDDVRRKLTAVATADANADVRKAAAEAAASP